MTEKGTSGIEKLRSFADDAAEFIRDVADQIELRHQLDVDAAVEETEDELGKRLMPEGLEWPRFEDGERVEFGSAVDGLDSPCEKFVFTRSMGGVCQLQDADGNMVNVLHGERVKRPESDVQGADGLPIKVGQTVYLVEGGGEPLVVKSAINAFKGVCVGEGLYHCANSLTHTPPDTQEQIDEDAMLAASDYWDCRGGEQGECPVKIDGKSHDEWYWEDR